MPCIQSLEIRCNYGIIRRLNDKSGDCRAIAFLGMGMRMYRDLYSFWAQGLRLIAGRESRYPLLTSVAGGRTVVSTESGFAGDPNAAKKAENKAEKR